MRVYIDCETTGLDPNACSIVELTLFCEETGAKYEFFMKPFEGADIQHEGLKVHGKCKEQFGGDTEKYLEYINENYKEHQKEVIRLKNIISCLFLEHPGEVEFAGWCVNFDIRFLKATLERFGYDFEYNYHVTDAKRIYKQMHYYRYASGRRCSLENAAEDMGVTFSAHTATGDALATRDIYNMIV